MTRAWSRSGTGAACKRRKAAEAAEERDVSSEEDSGSDELWELPPKSLRWRDIDEPDVPVPKLRFRPSRLVGPQLSLTSSYSPLQLFQLYFDSDVMSTLMTNTNAYGRRQPHFSPVCLKDMYSYIALVIYMGLVPLKTLLDYWRSSRLFTLPFPSRTMNRVRFNQISRCLHMNDPEVELENDLKKGSPEHDRLCRVRPLYERLLVACQAHYHPHQHISIDERMVRSKARIGFKQYVKNKPTKWGFKLFVLADSHGYTVNFFVYDGRVSLPSGHGQSSLSGHGQGSPSGHGQAYDVVMRLLSSTALGSGYRLYVDNYYSSPTLFRHLLRRHRMSACGTMRSTLRDCPGLGAASLRAPRGTIRWLRQNELLFVKWIDAREVTICSTLHSATAEGTVRRRVKDHSGRWTEKHVRVPDCVTDYNGHMGGVDLSDALIHSYNVLHKTRRWYKTLFFHFVDIAVVNAFILHRQLRLRPLTQKAFREALVLELADAGSAPKRRLIATYQAAIAVKRPPSDPVVPILSSGPGPDLSLVSPPSSGPEMDLGLVHLGHLPAAFAEQLRGVPSRMRGTRGRRTCVMCGNKTQVYCSVCLKTMCFNSSRNCYRDYHRKNHIAS
uniref:PiggyBac transposable element-derived protein domain-containing protein n=1 Tax=Knipowitschia caucasica TaxID=637954 RepID=A0AAV2LPJ5_KNICA